MGNTGADQGNGDDPLVTVVVNGEEYEVRGNENQQISVIVRHALKEAQQTRQPEDWQLRAGAGNDAQVLDPERKLRDYGITLPVTLFLNLHTGGGGNA